MIIMMIMMMKVMGVMLMSDRYVVGNIVVITLCIKSYVFALLLLLVIFYRIVLNVLNSQYYKLLIISNHIQYEH